MGELSSGEVRMSAVAVKWSSESETDYFYFFIKAFVCVFVLK